MRNILILGLVSLLTDIATEMTYPLIPLFLTSTLGATPGIVGIIEGLAESASSLLRVFSGAVSDWFGRRKPLAIGGYSFSSVGKIILVTSSSWPGVLAARLTDRFGKGIRTAPRDALIAESSDPNSRGAAFGLHRFLDTLGAAIGVLLAYFFLLAYHGDYRTVFLYSLIPALAGVAILFAVRETGGRTSPQQGNRLTFRWSALDKRLRAFLLVTFVFALGNSSNQFLLLRAQDRGFQPQTILLLYLAYNLVYALVSYPAGRLSDRVGRRTLLVTGYLAYGLVYFGFALAQNQSTIWALFSLYGIYIGFTEGVEKALVADIAPPDQKATLIGLHATLVGIGLLPASFLAGLLWDIYGAQAPFYFGSAMGLLAAAGLWWVLRPTRYTSPSRR